MYADVICLANARKRSERCVACVHAESGAWIRLVSGTEHGELDRRQRSLGSHGEPRKLDLIRVDLASRKSAPGQPENWLIARSPWQLLQRPATPAALRLLKNNIQTDDLIFGSAADRERGAKFIANPAAASLALVQPREVGFLFETIGSKQRVRTLFRLGKHRYNLSLTDPPVEEKLKSLPNGMHSCAEAGFDEAQLFFCISLGETFSDGNCYKLVAGVFELPLSAL